MESRDWSSDVCSSDLFPSHDMQRRHHALHNTHQNTHNITNTIRILNKKINTNTNLNIARHDAHDILTRAPTPEQEKTNRVIETNTELMRTQNLNTIDTHTKKHKPLNQNLLINQHVRTNTHTRSHQNNDAQTTVTKKLNVLDQTNNQLDVV